VSGRVRRRTELNRLARLIRVPCTESYGGAMQDRREPTSTSRPPAPDTRRAVGWARIAARGPAR